MVNRSEVVGRPLAALLANDGATVYSVDVSGVQKFTRGEGLRKRKHEVEELDPGIGMKEVAGLCEVVITGVPGEKYKFDTDLLKDGAVCINFSSEKVSDIIRSRVPYYRSSSTHTSGSTAAPLTTTE